MYLVSSDIFFYYDIEIYIKKKREDKSQSKKVLSRVNFITCNLRNKQKELETKRYIVINGRSVFYIITQIICIFKILLLRWLFFFALFNLKFFDFCLIALCGLYWHKPNSIEILHMSNLTKCEVLHLKRKE